MGPQEAEMTDTEAARVTRSPKWLLAATLLAASLVSPFSALAAKRVALVIGNAAYKDAPLRNPVNDVRAMAATLEGLGFDVIRLENATKIQMERGLVTFTSRLDEGASGLFYYAGHGVQIRGRNYLVPVGARFNSQQEARIESVGMDLVLSELAYAGNRLNIVILDACRNNPFERRLRGGSRGLAAIDAARGTLIAYATAPGSVAQDGDGRNGLYTEELLRALGKPGLKIEEVFKRVRVQVARRTNEQQIPWESSSLTGEFVFNRVSLDASPAVASARQNESVFWESAQRIDTVGAYQAYLAQYPDGVFAKLASIRIAELDAGPGRLEGSDAQLAMAEAELASRPEAKSKSALDEETAKGRRGKRDWIAILPLVGKSFGCNAAAFEPDKVRNDISYYLATAGLTGSIFRYLGWKVNLSPDVVWQSAGIRKVPISELVYKHGEELETDGMLLVWYEISGVVTCRIDYEIYLYDVVLKKLYREGATEGGLGATTERLASRFVQERALAQGSAN